ncbi:hypothetical protein AMTR_s00096p00111460 [Amborella trichopoda]|uniref:Uncharacterized protein n=1 Tax=Amborella trichopoda TaxID=13333 RepID=W1P488_AMBTC|nr:hypothetical protein AMTR_s00096p00111460 [Amborella trichopoda]
MSHGSKQVRFKVSLDHLRISRSYGSRHVRFKVSLDRGSMSMSYGSKQVRFKVSPDRGSISMSYGSRQVRFRVSHDCQPLRYGSSQGFAAIREPILCIHGNILYIRQVSNEILRDSFPILFGMVIMTSDLPLFFEVSQSVSKKTTTAHCNADFHLGPLDQFTLVFSQLMLPSHRLKQSIWIVRVLLKMHPTVDVENAHDTSMVPTKKDGTKVAIWQPFFMTCVKTQRIDHPSKEEERDRTRMTIVKLNLRERKCCFS